MLVQVGNRFVSEQSSYDASAMYARNMKDVLLQNKFFQDCHEEFIRDLIVNISRKRYATNRYLIEEGTRGDSMFVLYKGLVEVSANGRVICRLKDGSVFGEMALLDISNRRTATVKTLEKCDTAVIFRNTFFHILEKYPWERRKFQREAKRKLLQLGKLLNVRGEDINLSQQASDLDALRQIPFFSNEEFSDDFVSEIALNVTSQYLRPGTLVMQEGDPPSGKLFIMLRGIAEVSRNGKFMERIEHAVLGDVSLLGPGERAGASVRTVTACHVHTLERSVAQQILAKFPQERTRLLRYCFRSTQTIEDQEPAEKVVDTIVPTKYRSSGNCLGDAHADKAMMAANEELTANVEEEFLTSLTPYFSTLIMSGGIELISQGDVDPETDNMYFVQQGELTLWKSSILVRKLKAGDFFGESVCLSGATERTPRNYTVRTDSTVDLRVIKREAILLQMKKFSRAYFYFQRVAEEREKEANERVVSKHSTDSPHFDFLFLKCANPLQKRGKQPGALQTAQPMQLGLVVDFEGPGCYSAAVPLPDKLFDTVRQDTRAPALTDRPNHIHAGLVGFDKGQRPMGETWA
jgi:CRP-like cAMP-binding protein